MSAGTFAVLLILVPLLLAAVPACYAYESGSLFAADVGLLLLPAPVFLVSLLAFNKPAHVGWAGIAYPFVVFWLSVIILYIRVFLLPPIGLKPRSAALSTLIVAIAVAAFFGAFVPPFYE
jgi:hypothetical protein